MKIQKYDQYHPEFLMIPFQVIFSKGLTPKDKFVYGAILWYFQGVERKCAVTNREMATFLGMAPGSISNSITTLEKQGLIKRSFIKNGKGKEIIPLVLIKNSLPKRDCKKVEKAVVLEEKIPLDSEKTLDSVSSPADQTNETITLFKEIMPGDFIGKSNAYAIPATREAVKALLARKSLDQIREMIKKYAAGIGDKYRPSANTVYEFCTYKLAGIESWLAKDKSGGLWQHKAISSPEQTQKRKEMFTAMLGLQKSQHKKIIGENII